MVKFLLRESLARRAGGNGISIALTKELQRLKAKRDLRKTLGKLDHLKFEENSRQTCGEFAQKRRLPDNDSFKPVC